MEIYSTFPKAPVLKPYHQIKFSVIPRTHVGAGGSYPSAKVQPAYSTAPTDRVDILKNALSGNVESFQVRIVQGKVGLCEF